MTAAAAGFRRGDRSRAFLVACATFALLWCFTRLAPTTFNNYGIEAVSWLHGFVYLQHFPGDYIDAVPYHGRAYIIEAPLPALLLIPLLPFGDAESQTLLAYILTSVATAAGWLIARRSGVSAPWSAALCAFLLVGTSLAFCGSQGDVWFVAHCGSVAFSLLAIAECMHKRRPWVALLWALCAAFCRFPMFVAVPAYALALWPHVRRGWPAALAVALAFALPAMWFDYARWGTVVDIGFSRFYAIMRAGDATGHAPFELANVPRQLHALFVEPPRLRPWPPFFVGGVFGTGLLCTSPAFVLALFAPWRAPLTRVWWFAAFCCAVPALMYYDTGMVQDGTRHALDFEPFLFALVALAFGNRTRWWYGVPIAWSLFYGLGNLAVWSFARAQVPW